jgi:allophanate hydrolase subunit 2
MASEGLVEGAIQVTPSGGPIVMLANHPTTGGYPVIAVVEPDDLSIVAQSRPGASLQFREYGTPGPPSR